MATTDRPILDLCKYSAKWRKSQELLRTLFDLGPQALIPITIRDNRGSSYTPQPLSPHSDWLSAKSGICQRILKHSRPRIRQRGRGKRFTHLDPSIDTVKLRHSGSETDAALLLASQGALPR